MQHRHVWTRVAAVVALGATTAFAGTTIARPKITITSPKNRATIDGPKVVVQVAVTGWKLVAAGSPLAEREGHLHFFIDVPTSSVKEGEMIPLDQPTKYVHAGKAPFDTRELDLGPGTHTITAVMANSAHVRAAGVRPASVTITVK